MINNLELKLSNLEDIENMRRFEQFKHFQCLSLQKPSKQYTKLLKNSKKSESINIIKDDGGNDFIDSIF